MVTWEYQIPFVIVTLDASCAAHDAVKPRRCLYPPIDHSSVMQCFCKKNRLTLFSTYLFREALNATFYFFTRAAKCGDDARFGNARKVRS